MNEQPEQFEDEGMTAAEAMDIAWGLEPAPPAPDDRSATGNKMRNGYIF